jgi:hypothetical protein
VRGITDNNDIFALADPASREALQTLIALYLSDLINEISHTTITLPKPKNLCDYRQKIHKFVIRRETYADIFPDYPSTV